jgi:hypothetical protein
VRWSLDGEGVYFRWHSSPSPADLPEADPWYRVDRSGASAELVPAGDIHAIPGESPSWSRDGARACWSREGSLYVYDGATRSTVQVLSLSTPLAEARMLSDGSACDFRLDENLHRYRVERHTFAQITRKDVAASARSASDAWREKEETELFARTRDSKERESETRNYRQSLEPSAIQVLTVEPGVVLEEIRLTPDGRHVTFRARKPSSARRMTSTMDYVTRSGDAESREARPKVGDLEDESRLGIVKVGDRKGEPAWVDVSSFGSSPALVHGPYWSLEGDRALIQVLSTGHKDRWIAELDVESGRVKALVHDRDDAWLGGPPPVAGYLEPALLEWLPGGRFVFASERSGWSHLYLVEPGREPRALTEGAWCGTRSSAAIDRSGSSPRAGNIPATTISTPCRPPEASSRV